MKKKYIMVIEMIRDKSDQSIIRSKGTGINETINAAATNQAWINKFTYKSKDRNLDTLQTKPDVIIINSKESNNLRQVRIEYPDEAKVEVSKIVINLGDEIDRIRV